MEKLGSLPHFKEIQNLILEGFDPVSAGGFTQVPNCIINDKNLSLSTKVTYAKLLSYAWTSNHVFPGQERMAEELGATRKTIYTAITELQKVGYLQVQRRGQGLTNIYILRHTVNPKTKK